MNNDQIIQEATEAVTKGYPCAFYVPQLLEVIKNKEAEVEKKDTEIEILIRKKEALRDDISELTAEVERLKAEADMADGYADVLEAKAKSEAYREFAERLVDIAVGDWCHKVDVATITDTLKELTESNE